MTNREHIAIIFSKVISTQEKHQRQLSAEEIRVREALLWLAERVDELERYKFDTIFREGMK